MANPNHSLDPLRDIRVALVKFAAQCGFAIRDADGEVHRTLHWLELEQLPYWTTQIRNRETLVNQWKDAVRQKQLYKDSTGGRQSAIDELKNLARAQASLLEAQERYTATRQYVRKLQKQQMEYRGQVQKLSLALAGDVRECLARLTALQNTISEYGRSAEPTETRSMAQDPTTATSAAPPPPAPTPAEPTKES
jgi:hypothetical protein